MERIGFIYKITNPNGGIYIGKTLRLKDRISKYRCCSSIQQQRILYNSIKKYGWDNHIFEVIDETNSENLSKLEIFYIKKFNSYRHTNEKGMNLTLGGDGSAGRIDSEEVKLKRANSNRGGKRTENSKYLMSIAKKGKPSTRIGYVCSEETKQKVSIANKGRVQTSETIQKRKDSCLKKMIEKYGCILQLDMITGDVIKEWYLLPNDINQYFDTVDSNIRKCLKGQKLHALGYKWKYKLEI